MVILVLAGLYALLVPLGFGVWFVRIIRYCLSLADEEPVAALTTWLSGLMLLTVMLEIGSLLGPLHTVAHLTAAAIGGAGLWQPEGRQLLVRLVSRARQLHGLVQALGILLVLSALAMSTMPPINIDTGYYHAQSVRWLEEMGIVPGLANIEIHIGFNSAWFVPEALFSWGRYVGSPLQVLNMVFFTLFGWYGLLGLENLLRRRFEPSDGVRMVLAAAMVFWLQEDLASLSPDPAVTLLIFYILVQSLVLPPARPGQPLRTAQVAIILLCVFAVTIKLSTLPILLLALWWTGRSGSLLNGRFLLVMTSLSLVLVGPWLVRNYIISGYLVFPVTAIDLFNPSWKFPVVEMRLQNDYIKEFARNADYYDRISVHDKPWQFWLPLWWKQQFLPNKIMLLSIPALLLISLPFGWWQYRQGKLPQASKLLVALAVAVSGVVFWFVLAPAFRFGYGSLLATLALLLLPWLWVAAQRAGRPLAFAFALATAMLLVFTPMVIEYRHYIIASYLTPAQYHDFLGRLPAPDDKGFISNQFPRVSRDTLWEKGHRSFGERARLIRLLVRTNGYHGSFTAVNGLSWGNGLVKLPSRLVWPAGYPIIAVQPLPLPPVLMLQSRTDRMPWYAPFPFAARRKQCAARGPRLADGFVAKVVPIHDWRREARW